MTTHMYHGVNTPMDSGRLSPMTRYVPNPKLRDYGWTMPPCSLGKARRVVDRDVHKLKDGDWLFGYSHGALICHLMLLHPDCPKIAGVIVVQPALREDTDWPERTPVLCLYNHKDLTVVFGRLWGRLAHGGPTGWGSAGRNGFSTGKPHVTSIDTASKLWEQRAEGHHEVLKDPVVDYWGKRIARWVRTVEKEQEA